MSTKKQRRDAGILRKAQELAESRASGQRAQAADKERRAERRREFGLLAETLNKQTVDDSMDISESDLQ